jgi:hypothetical protein
MRTTYLAHLVTLDFITVFSPKNLCHMFTVVRSVWCLATSAWILQPLSYE